MAASNQPAHGRPGSDPDEGDPGAESDLLDSLTADSPSRAARALAFWTAVALPFLHVPLLTTGLTGTGERHAFVVLLALNAVALYVGHDYGSE